MDAMQEFERYADDNQKALCRKFPATHFLSSPDALCNIMLWITFFRRNLHRFAMDYLGIRLYPYQIVLLYYLGIGRTVVVAACRASAKSFIIALYACCHAILYPGSKIVIGSEFVKQSRLIITEKIQNELMNMSPALRREIAKIVTNGTEQRVNFHNGSSIVVVNSRGPRSNVAIREECFYMDQSFANEVLAPMQVNWMPDYCKLPEYVNVDELKIKPVDIYISSVALDNGHWMWKVIDDTLRDMLKGKNRYVFAFDESITLLHGIKSKEQLIDARRISDPISFSLEYKNRRIKENTSAFFSYSMLTKNQNVKKVFYPRQSVNVLSKKHATPRSNPFFIPRQEGEIRIVSCDFAFVDRNGNDNSAFSCIRALPESKRYGDSDRSVEVKRGYRRILSYMETTPGGDTDKQAIRVRQLYEDFDADYLVLDLRNGGPAIYYKLAKVMYDESRDCEYSPMTCMNDDVLASAIRADGAQPVIYAITASQKLNSAIANGFRESLSSGSFSLPVSLKVAQDEILPNYSGYLNGTPDEQVAFEKPFIETQLMIAETAALVYEKKDQTGITVIHEQGKNTKDRYTSVSYGDYFISLLERDLLSDEENDIGFDVKCISAVTL